MLETAICLTLALFFWSSSAAAKSSGRYTLQRYWSPPPCFFQSPWQTQQNSYLHLHVWQRTLHIIDIHYCYRCLTQTGHSQVREKSVRLIPSQLRVKIDLPYACSLGFFRSAVCNSGNSLCYTKSTSHCQLHFYSCKATKQRIDHLYSIQLGQGSGRPICAYVAITDMLPYFIIQSCAVLHVVGECASSQQLKQNLAPHWQVTSAIPVDSQESA